MVAQNPSPRDAAPSIEAGIVSLTAPALMPDGREWQHVWCGEWRLAAPISGTIWFIDAVVANDAGVQVAMRISGSQVVCWTACDAPPKSASVFVI